MPTLEKWYFNFSDREAISAKEMYEDTEFQQTMFSLYHGISLRLPWDKDQLIKEQGASRIKFDFPVEFRVSGKVYGRKGYSDGKAINTSDIAKLLFEDDAWVAVTQSGSTYRLGEMHEVEKTRAKVEERLIKDKMKSYLKSNPEEAIIFAGLGNEIAKGVVSNGD